MPTILGFSRGKVKRLHLIGDSHFALHHAVVGVEPYHIGPVTMHRVGREGEKILNLAAIRFEQDDALGFVFGEIDIRVHIANQRDTSAREPNKILDDLASRYFAALIAAATIKGVKHVVVFSCVPPAGLGHPNFDPQYPRNGSDSERVAWTKGLNDRIRLLAVENSFGFVDQYTPFADDDGLLSMKSSLDGVHIRKEAYAEVDWSAAFNQQESDTTMDWLPSCGCIIGWEKALLGNGLSCLANLFLLSRRTSLPAVYSYPQAYQDLFVKNDVAVVDPDRRLDRSRLGTFLAEHSDLFSIEPVLVQNRFAGISFEDLASLKQRGSLCFTEHRVGLTDWRDDGADLAVRDFCQQGNGLVITGCYWRQYLDMRELGEDGKALRAHLGPTRQERGIGRRNRMALEKSLGHLRIGVHLRLATDYTIWMGGVYHFPLEQTAQAMRNISADLAGRAHTFYLFSDLPLEHAAFASLPCHYERGEYLDDFIALCSCDYVVGPPSTFASWAAFLGQTKRIVLTKERITHPGARLMELAVDVPFPTGHYLPGDPTGRTI